MADRFSAGPPLEKMSCLSHKTRVKLKCHITKELSTDWGGEKNKKLPAESAAYSLT